MSLPLPSLLVGRYQLARLLGEGGFAETYLATDTVLGRQVAIKLLRQRLARDPEYVARFNREARIAASINHPNVIEVYDFGRDEELLFLVMEWVNGTTLKELIREQAPLPIPEAKLLIVEVLQGLGAIHRAGIIHRDIKPQNVLLDRTGPVKLSDFGIAKAAVGTGLEELTRSGEFLGTPTHMAPEQVTGAKTLGPEADLYGVGVLLFELLTGELPFSGDTPLQVALKQLHEPPPALRPLNAAIPEDLEVVVLKALAKEPGARYQSAAAMEAALESGRVELSQLAAEAEGADADSLAEETVKPSRSRRSIPAEPAEQLSTLTPRQREVLTLVVSGFSDAKIARRLSIQTRTVQGHIAALQRIAGVSMRDDLKTWAKAGGITPQREDRGAEPPPPLPPPAKKAGGGLGKLAGLIFLMLMPVFIIGGAVKGLTSESFRGGLGDAVIVIILVALAVFGYLWAIWDILKGRHEG